MTPRKNDRTSSSSSSFAGETGEAPYASYGNPVNAPYGSDATETLAAIGPIARSSVVDAVADRLRDQILSGRLEAGSRLPSEREFALALGVNRLTLRAALARLEALGLVVTRHGAGTIVASWRERAGLEALAALLGSIDPREAAFKELLTSMLEVRRIIASEAIALAAERHTPADIEIMVARAAEQKGRVHDVGAFARGDIAFERALVRAARNVGLELLLNTFARFPDEQPALVARLYDRCEDTLAFYPLVIALVQQGDAAHARQTMRDALLAIDVEWQARNGGPAAAPAASREPGSREPGSREPGSREPKQPREPGTKKPKKKRGAR
jgi:GntR family transcriptional regulator, transcriptional repressor for pyruvate dehydrogenase complex